jgi:type VI secretion system protein ImpM
VPGIVTVSAVGFYGKLPARGDFVRVGLPRSFTDPWDDWLQSVIAGTRTLMGEDWLPAFLEAPVWRFVLAPGLCGEQAAIGLMLPSVDRAGRYFPLTFAALRPSVSAAPGDAETWLDRCEAAGRAALERDTSPQAIADGLGVPDLSEQPGDADGSVWWSEGSPRVRPARVTLPGLPDAGTYAAMLGAAPGEAGTEASGEARWKFTP